MYRAIASDVPNMGLLGDCFLIRLVDGDRKSHILIDAGMLMGSPNAVARMAEIAEDIVLTTGGSPKPPVGGEDAEVHAGTLDLLVVTHEHWDHISGFSQAQDILLNDDRLKIANLWMAWTEKDGDPQVEALRAKFDKTGFAIASLAKRILPGGAQGRQGLAAQLNSASGFLGLADGPTRRLQGREIIGAIKQQVPQRQFLEAGTVLATPSASAGGPSLRAYVLGPPRDETFLFKDKPSSGPAQETYLTSNSLGEAIVRFTDGDQAPCDTGSPFAQHFCRIDAKSLFAKVQSCAELDGEQAWIADRYCRVKGAPSARQAELARRRIDEDWLAAAGPLALKLDADTNNTSLVLAFDLPDGTSMLFAADAQVGNWLSWHQQTYTDESGVVHTATQLLNRTRFYKVGHHGSHNATLDKLGLALMTRDDLVAAIPTDEELGKKQGGKWQMPNPRVREALMERTKGRIMRNDRRYKGEGLPDDPELKTADPSFLQKLTETELYLEYRIF
jgi:hypothetical protein